MSRIVLTFKNNDKEKKIEEFLESKVSPAGYLKELVWEVINEKQALIQQSNDSDKVVINKEHKNKTSFKPLDPTQDPF